MHFSILLCHAHASMHCWKDSSGMLLSSIVTALLMTSTPSKWVPKMGSLELREKKRVTRSKIRWIRRLFQYGDVLLGQELPDAQGVVSRCIVVVKQPRFVLPQLSSLLAHWAKQKLQDLFVDLLTDRLALWQKLTVDDASDIEEHDQHDFDFWFWLSSCLLSSASATSETSSDSSGARFPGRTQKSVSHQQWWHYEASLVQFEDAQWCPDTPACGAPSDHNSAALAPILCRLSAWEEV